MVGTGRFELPTPRTPSDIGTTIAESIAYGISSESDNLRRNIMQAGFEKFIKERKYLTNVTPATIEWYTHAFKWLDTDAPSQEELRAAVLKMRAKGLKAKASHRQRKANNRTTDNSHRFLHQPRNCCWWRYRLRTNAGTQLYARQALQMGFVVS